MSREVYSYTPSPKYKGKFIQKVVGSIDNYGIFTKVLSEENHMLKVPKAWCYDIETIDKHLDFIKVLKIVATDTGIVYSTTLSHFLNYAGKLNRGFGEQYYLTYDHWTQYNSANPTGEEDYNYQMKMEF